MHDHRSQTYISIKNLNALGKKQLYMLQLNKILNTDEQEKDMKKNSDYKPLIVLVFLCMAIFGLIDNLKGTLIPSIRNEFGVDYSAIGTMLFVSSLGYLSASLISGIVADKLGKKAILMSGFILLIISTSLFYKANSFPVTVILMFLISTSFGCIEVAVNSLGAQIFVRNAAIMMNMTHLFYGLGSAISPKYAGNMLATNLRWSYIYTITLAILVPGFIYMAFLRFPKSPEDQNNDKLPVAKLLRDKKVWLIIATLGFCTVAEVGMANWLVNFLQVVRGMNVEQSSLYMTFYFASFMLGRFFGGYIAERIGYIRIILYFAIISVILFSSGMMLPNSFAFLFSCIGFFVSIMFPTMMSVIMKEFPTGTSSVMGLVISAAGGINMIINWIIGKTNDMLNVNFGFMSISLYMMLIVVFIIPLRKKTIFDKSPIQEDMLAVDKSPVQM